MVAKKMSPKMEDKNKWKKELLRQSFHLGLGFFLSGVLFFTNLDFFRTVALIMLGVGIIVAYIAKTKKFPVLNKLLQSVERKNEYILGQSAFLFVIGALIPSFVFSNADAVFLGIFALTWQDGFSTLIGVRYGKTKILPNKSLEGSLGGLVVCTLGLSIFLPFTHALLLAVAATLVEMLPVDDSLSVPFAVAFLARAFV